ncbi:SDR family NAD(P)-dependent oxidoreductase [Marinifilum sp.]|uniref:SDR family NAD(P)-dependent oxidoreductase n=1 Tax=Marinifilum sp. TaxID=2033137 RepID=UPI003BABFFEC
MKKIAFITGATAGIGEACAKRMAKAGYDLIISGRREENLNQLEKEIIKESNCKICKLVVDVRKQEDVFDKITQLPKEWQNIDLLINNAGLAVGISAIQDGVIDDWERMIDTNIKGLLYITRAVSPLMIERKKGHIINVTSIAGKEVYPGGNVYCATKHAVDALTKGMRIDMLPHNIKVSSVAPGMVETEFSVVRFKGDKSKADQVYNGFTPLYAEDIADTVEFIASRPAHVNINDVLIMPTAQASARDLVRN